MKSLKHVATYRDVGHATKGEWVKMEMGFGRRYMATHLISADIELWVDLELIGAVLADKATRNKSGKARMARGAIEARAVNLKTMPIPKN